MWKKWNLKNILLFIVFLCFFTSFIVSGYRLLVKWNESKRIDEQLNTIHIASKISEVSDTNNTKIITPKGAISKSNPYWDYIKMPLISVDFTELKKINNSTRGWIQVNGTNINYPIVQAKNNSYYLTHSFDKSYNGGGWIFMDYRNHANDFDTNTIIYGHGMYNGTMFGSLKNIVKSNWYTNSDNYVVKLSTENENTLWQVFSVYHVKTTTDYLKTNFSSDEEYESFLDMILSRSVFDFKTEVEIDDKIITLSTCYDKKEKVVLHAKLIKKETRLQ